MFSGIIRHRAKVINVEERSSGRTLTFEVPKDLLKRAKEGDSFAFNGVCFTVSKKGRSSISTEVMPQTLRVTTANDWFNGETVNIEPSLRVGDEVGGHFVYGHVDTVAEVVGRHRDGDATLLSFSVPRDLLRYLVPRASVAVDGVSLTIAEADDKTFTVSLLEQTLNLTNLKDVKVNDRVNIEVDMLMRLTADRVAAASELN